MGPSGPFLFFSPSELRNRALFDPSSGAAAIVHAKRESLYARSRSDHPSLCRFTPAQFVLYKYCLEYRSDVENEMNRAAIAVSVL